MLVWTALGAIAAAVVLAVRWLLRSRDSLGRPRAFPVISVVGLALLGGALLVPVVRHARLEHRLGSVATALVGVEARVNCQGAGEEFVDAGAELGYVRYGPAGVPERETLIKRQQCKALRSYLSSDRERPSRDQVVAVHILSHEARHMAGTTVESVAECQALQRDALTARLLGATVEQAQALARTYWLEVYPRMSSDYRTPECAPGGRLDERLEPAPWSMP